MNEENGKGFAAMKKGLNFNTIVGVVVLAVVSWVGTRLSSVSDDMVRLKAVIEVREANKAEQLNRIEGVVNRQQQQINELQLDIARIKTKP